MQHPLTVFSKPVDHSKVITQLNSVLLAEEHGSHAPDGILQVRPKQRRNLLTPDTRYLESKNALPALTNLQGIPVLAYEPHSQSQVVNTIRGATRDITDVDLRSTFCATVPVCNTKCLDQSETVKLVLATKTSPDHVTVGTRTLKLTN